MLEVVLGFSSLVFETKAKTKGQRPKTKSVVQNRWRQWAVPRTHFEAHFSWGWRRLSLSQSDQRHHPSEGSLPSSRNLSSTDFSLCSRTNYSQRVINTSFSSNAHTYPSNTDWSLCYSQKGISIVKKLKERALCLPGKLPAPTILAKFSLEFGSGSPLPLTNAWCNGYRLWTSLVRVCRR